VIGPQRGIEKGIEKGILDGRLQGKQDALKTILETRFGPLSQVHSNRIEKINSVEELDRLIREALRSSQLDELKI